MDKVITGFKKEGRRIPKIVVFLDEEAWVTLDPETVVRERLRSGLALTPGRREEILATDEAIRARKAAAGHASHTPKTRRELEHYLRGRRFSEKATQDALEKLSASGTVDDERVTGELIRLRRRKHNIGPKRLEAELRTRGIPAAKAEGQISKAMEGVDLAAECLELARRYVRRYEPLAEAAVRRKFAAFLLRRGYAAEQVWAAIRQIGAENDVPVEEEDL